jgi:hypothetical protein
VAFDSQSIQPLWEVPLTSQKLNDLLKHALLGNWSSYDPTTDDILLELIMYLQLMLYLILPAEQFLLLVQMYRNMKDGKHVGLLLRDEFVDCFGEDLFVQELGCACFEVH